MIDAGSTMLDCETLQKIEGLLSRRCEVCRGLMESAGQQNALIEADESSERLMAVLGRKQTLVNQLQRIGRELKPLKELWHEKMDSVEAGRRERIRQLSDRAEEILKRVVDMEEVGRSQVMQSRGRPVGKLTRLDRGRRLAHVYSKPAHDVVRAIDQQM